MFELFVNSAAVNHGIRVSFSILVSSAYMPRSGIAGSYDGFILGGGSAGIYTGHN